MSSHAIQPQMIDRSSNHRRSAACHCCTCRVVSGAKSSNPWHNVAVNIIRIKRSIRSVTPLLACSRRCVRGPLLSRCRPRFEASISVARVGPWSKHPSYRMLLLFTFVKSRKYIRHSTPTIVDRHNRPKPQLSSRLRDTAFDPNRWSG